MESQHICKFAWFDSFWVPAKWLERFWSSSQNSRSYQGGLTSLLHFVSKLKQSLPPLSFVGPFLFLGLRLWWHNLRINLALQLTLYCYLDHSGAGERRVAPRKGRRETLGTRLHSSIKGAYAIGRQDDEKMSRKIGNAQSRATFFRHSAVLNLPAVLLRKLPNAPRPTFIT